jgi:hypothetical protein
MDLLITVDEATKDIPNLDLCQIVYQYETLEKQGDTSSCSALKTQILNTINEKAMGPYYTHVCQQLKWDVDDAALTTMK